MSRQIHQYYHSSSKHSHRSTTNENAEYGKFAFVIGGIVFVTLILSYWQQWQIDEIASNFMGVFLLTFGGFKIFNLKEFANGFAGYDIIARKYILYGYLYPVIQLVLGAGFVLLGPLHILSWLTLIVSSISSIGVYQALSSNSRIHCVCLGNVIKLPLSTISFVEDFGMALMALIMIITAR